MINKTAIRTAVLHAIEQFPKEQEVYVFRTYRWVETDFPDACSRRGDARNEPRYKHDVRLAVWDAMPLGIIRHTGIRGQRERI
jgi:hypothetical protein